MWPFGMTRQELEAFLQEYSDVFIGILLDAYPMTVDEIVANHMEEEAEAFTSEANYWEAC